MSKRLASVKGRSGVAYLVATLQYRGVDARMTRGSHPFDVLVYDPAGRLVAGIENKDLGPGVNGTRIDGPAKKRKLAYAERHHFTKMFTTVTLRHSSMIGYAEGIRNLHIDCFTYEIGGLICELQHQ